MKITKKHVDQIIDLARTESNPFYIYDTSTIRLNCRKLTEIPYQEKSIHYATMANIHPKILDIVRDEKMYVFVNSLLHLEKVQDAGFSEKEIAYSASALDDDSIKTIKNSGAQINLDSPNQIRRWKMLFSDASFGIRCNIGPYVTPRHTHAGYFIGNESRLGLTIEELTEFKDDDHVRGLHIYVGTDILDVDYFLQCYEALCGLTDMFPSLEYLNFGGGFGIKEDGNNSFSMTDYRLRVSRLMSEISDRMKRRIHLVLEPGRMIAGNSGFFVTRITDIKERNGSQFIGVNASSVQFPRPLFYPDVARHPVIIVRDGKKLRSPVEQTSCIYGCSTYSRDFLAKSVELPQAMIGDFAIFGNAGAYSAAAYTDFLGFPRPGEFFM